MDATDRAHSRVVFQVCEHSQAATVAAGFRAMRFDLVCASNRGAVRLWQRLGFAIVGTLPGAFAHPSDGFVDAYVMYKVLPAAGR